MVRQLRSPEKRTAKILMIHPLGTPYRRDEHTSQNAKESADMPTINDFDFDTQAEALKTES